MTGDEIMDVKELLVKQKGALFKEYLDRYKKKDALNPIPLKELEESEQKEVKIKTGTVIDEIISGGIPEGKSLLMYGAFRSGKTQTCLTMAVLCPNRVIYIDPEKSLRIERLKQICDTRGLNWESIRDKIIYYRPKSWVEQMMIIQSLPAPSDTEKVDLIICDSISKLFRGIEFLGRETVQVKNGLIREFVLALERIADLHQAALVYTTQIYDKPVATPYASLSDIQMPIGGRSVEHQPDFILFFRKATGNVRVVEMMDSSYTALAERAFLINERGIDNVPDSAKVAKALKEREEKFAEKQAQENIEGKKPKKEGEEIPESEESSEES